MPTTVNAEQVRALTHLNDANSADREAPRGISEAGGASIEAARRAERLNAEVEFYREALRRIVEVTSAAAQGNLEARLLGCDDSEKLRQVAQSVNHLLDMTDAFLRKREQRWNTRATANSFAGYCCAACEERSVTNPSSSTPRPRRCPAMRRQ